MEANSDGLLRHLLLSVAYANNQGLSAKELVEDIDAFHARHERLNKATTSHGEEDVGDIFLSVRPPAQKVNIDSEYLESIWRNVAEDSDIHVRDENDLSVGATPAAENNDAASSAAPASLYKGFLDAHKQSRLFITEERIWHAITGHGPDSKRVPKLELECLKIIASRGQAGILQPDLVATSGQDKRSVPKRTDMLHQKGYIIKEACVGAGTKTSLLRLKRFAVQEESAEAHFQIEATNWSQDASVSMIRYDQWFDEIVEQLNKHNRLVTTEDLRRGLGINDNSRLKKSLHRCLRRLAESGMIRTLKAPMDVSQETEYRATLASKVKKTHYFRCVKMLREPLESDRRAFRKQSKGPSPAELLRAAVSRPKDVNDDEDDDEDEDADYEDDITLLETLGQSTSPVQDNMPPQWTPDIHYSQFLFDFIDSRGVDGISSMELGDRAFGHFYKRPFDEIMGRLTDVWHVSQPPHLRHLAIVRDTSIFNTITHYTYRTFANFQLAVDAGKASWDYVLTDEQVAKYMSVKPTLDEWGFPVVPVGAIYGRDGASSVAHCAISQHHPRKNRKPFIRIQTPATKHTPAAKQTPTRNQNIARNQVPAHNQTPPRNQTPAHNQNPARNQTPEPTAASPQAQATDEQTRMDEPNASDHSPEHDHRTAAFGQDTDATAEPNLIYTFSVENDVSARRREKETQLWQGRTRRLAQKIVRDRELEAGRSAMQAADASEPPTKRTCRKSPETTTAADDGEGVINTALPLNDQTVHAAGPSDALGSSTRPAIPKEIMTQITSVPANGGTQSEKTKKRKREQIQVSEEEVLKVQTEILSMSKPAVYIGPPGSTRHFSRGRPRNSIIAVFKSEHLARFDWFKNDEHTNNRKALPAPTRRRKMQKPKRALGTSLTSAEAGDAVNIKQSEALKLPRSPQPATPIASLEEVTYAEPSTATPVRNSTYRESEEMNRRVDFGHADATDVVTGVTKSPMDIEPAQHSTAAIQQIAPDLSGHAPPSIAVAMPETPSKSSLEQYGTHRHMEQTSQAAPEITHIGMADKAHEIAEQDPTSATTPMELDSNINFVYSPVTDRVAAPPKTTGKRLKDQTKPKARHQTPKKAGLQRTGGIITHQRTKIVLDIVKQCGGAFPGDSEIYFSFACMWVQLHQLVPDRSTLENITKGLLASGKLQRITFVFETTQGNQVKKRLLLEEGMDMSHPLAQEMQREMIERYPAHYVPAAAPLTEEMRRKIDSHPGNVRRKSENLIGKLHKLYPTEEKESVKRTFQGPVTLGMFEKKIKADAEKRYKKLQADERALQRFQQAEDEREIQEAEQGLQSLQSTFQASSYKHEPKKAHIDRGPHGRKRLAKLLHLNKPNEKPRQKPLGSVRQLREKRRLAAAALAPHSIPAVTYDHVSLTLTEPTQDYHSVTGTFSTGATITRRYFHNQPTVNKGKAQAQAQFQKLMPSSLQDIIERARNLRSSQACRPKYSGEVAQAFEHELFRVAQWEMNLHNNPYLHNRRCEPAVFINHTVPKDIVEPDFSNFSWADDITEIWLDRPRRLTDPVKSHKTVKSGPYRVTASKGSIPTRGSYNADTADSGLSEMSTPEGPTPTQSHHDLETTDDDDEQYDMLVPERSTDAHMLSDARTTNPTGYGQLVLELDSYSDSFANTRPVPALHCLQGLLVPDTMDVETALREDKETTKLLNSQAVKNAALMKRFKDLNKVHAQSESTAKEQASVGYNHDGVEQKDKVGSSELERPTLRRKRLSMGHNRLIQTFDSMAEIQMTDEDERRLLLAIAVVRTLAGGLDQGARSINWGFVNQALNYKFGARYCRQRWAAIRYKGKHIMEGVQSRFRDLFIEAYEQNDVPTIDLAHPEQIKWAQLLAWAETNLSLQEFSVFNLPRDMNTLNKDMKVEMPGELYELEKEDFYNPLATQLRKEEMAHAATRFARVTEPVSEKHDEGVNLALAKSWIRATVLTLDDSYDQEVAFQKLHSLGDDLVDHATEALQGLRIIRAENKGRTLPGRNYVIADQVLAALKRSFDVDKFHQAAQFKAHLDSEFQRNGRIEIDYHAADAQVMAVENLVASGRVIVKPMLPPIDHDFDAPFPKLTKWGFIDSGYDSKRMDRERLHFGLELVPSDSYVEGNPTKLVSKPLVRHFPGESGERLPYWTDIHGLLIEQEWNTVLVSVLYLLVTRPGLTTEGLAKAHKYKLWVWELEMMLEWAEKSGIVRKTEVDGDFGWTTDEWWWLALVEHNDT